nr:double headed trypsin inhibitor MCI1 [Momordica charantia]
IITESKRDCCSVACQCDKRLPPQCGCMARGFEHCGMACIECVCGRHGDMEESCRCKDDMISACRDCNDIIIKHIQRG